MIHIRTNTGYAAVTVVSLLAGAVAAPVVLLASLRNPLPAIRRAIKPAALWINAWLYKISEEEVEWLSYTRQRMYQLALIDGPEARYYIRCGRDLEARERKQRQVQWKLRARRDWINQW